MIDQGLLTRVEQDAEMWLRENERDHRFAIFVRRRINDAVRHVLYEQDVHGVDGGQDDVLHCSHAGIIPNPPLSPEMAPYAERVHIDFEGPIFPSMQKAILVIIDILSEWGVQSHQVTDRHIKAAIARYKFEEPLLRRGELITSLSRSCENEQPTNALKHPLATAILCNLLQESDSSSQDSFAA